MSNNPDPWLNQRFRGYLPIVIDIETGGFNAKTDAILEIGACIIGSEANQLFVESRKFYEIIPFEGANIEQSAIQFTGIDLNKADRQNISETMALKDLFSEIRAAVKRNDCKRAILVGHNAAFDISFLNEAISRNNIKRSPFHPFSTLDTVSLGALSFQQTVLAKCCEAAGIEFDNEKAHNAGYDADKTAELFCLICNHYQKYPSPINK